MNKVVLIPEEDRQLANAAFTVAGFLLKGLAENPMFGIHLITTVRDLPTEISLPLRLSLRELWGGNPHKMEKNVARIFRLVLLTMEDDADINKLKEEVFDLVNKVANS